MYLHVGITSSKYSRHFLLPQYRLFKLYNCTDFLKKCLLNSLKCRKISNSISVDKNIHNHGQ